MPPARNPARYDSCAEACTHPPTHPPARPPARPRTQPHAPTHLVCGQHIALHMRVGAPLPLRVTLPGRPLAAAGTAWGGGRQEARFGCSGSGGFGVAAASGQGQQQPTGLAVCAAGAPDCGPHQLDVVAQLVEQQVLPAGGALHTRAAGGQRRRQLGMRVERSRQPAPKSSSLEDALCSRQSSPGQHPHALNKGHLPPTKSSTHAPPPPPPTSNTTRSTTSSTHPDVWRQEGPPH